jgi:hypothetical protein
MTRVLGLSGFAVGFSLFNPAHPTTVLPLK